MFVKDAFRRGWEHEAENAALAKLTLQLDASALVLDGPFGNGEAQAVSALGPGTGFVHSIEALEDLLLMLRRDARPLVGNFNDGFPVAPGGTDGDVRLRR